MCKGKFLFSISLLMFFSLIIIQLMHVSPYKKELPEDPYKGVSLTTYQSLVETGAVTLEVIGPYFEHSVMIFKNGERYRLVDKFPLTINVSANDLIEILVLDELVGSSIIIKEKTKNIKLQFSRTTIPLNKGMHRVARVLMKS